MQKREKVLVFGYFGKRSHIMEGQSVKTRNMSRLLRDMGCDVSEFDTESFRYDPLSVAKMLVRLMRCDKVCVLPAHNNLKWIVPLIYILSLVFRYKIYLFTIGGRLHIYLRSMPFHRFFLGRIARIFNETRLLGDNLRDQYGYKNLTYCPNFKFVDFTPQIHHTAHHLKLVFLARIVAEKGLDVIFDYCDFLRRNNRSDVEVDFYGMIASKDEDYFNTKVTEYDFVNYKGVAQQSDIPSILEQYDAMAFPTHYPTEGIPGSILDAYISGIPVIATNWVYASELIDDGKSGIIVPFENSSDDFIKACEWLLEHEEKLKEMKVYAHGKSRIYHADNVKRILSAYF
ncbi:MAG: glycosyltransferase family 4 protein [Prevotella sp.]|nr:glycosyltransferase family 4 protein [Prevotella sp.]